MGKGKVLERMRESEAMVAGSQICQPGEHREVADGSVMLVHDEPGG